MNRNSDIWWFHLARRVLGWSAAGALLWAMPVMAFWGGLALLLYLNPSPPHDPDNFLAFSDESIISLLLWVCGLNGASFTIMGISVGTMAAMHAPVDDPKNPFKSQIFRSLSARTFLFTAMTSIFCAFTVKFFWILFPFGEFFFSVGIWFVISAALFIYILRANARKMQNSWASSNYDA